MWLEVWTVGRNLQYCGPLGEKKFYLRKLINVLLIVSSWYVKLDYDAFWTNRLTHSGGRKWKPVEFPVTMQMYCFCFLMDIRVVSSKKLAKKKIFKKLATKRLHYWISLFHLNIDAIKLCAFWITDSTSNENQFICFFKYQPTYLLFTLTTKVMYYVYGNDQKCSKITTLIR